MQDRNNNSNQQENEQQMDNNAKILTQIEELKNALEAAKVKDDKDITKETIQGLKIVVKSIKYAVKEKQKEVNNANSDKNKSAFPAIMAVFKTKSAPLNAAIKKITSVQDKEEELQALQNLLKEAKQALEDAEKKQKEGEKALKAIKEKLLNVIIEQKVVALLNDKKSAMKQAVEDALSGDGIHGVKIAGNKNVTIPEEIDGVKLTTEQQKGLKLLIEGIIQPQDLHNTLENESDNAKAKEVQQKIAELENEVNKKIDKKMAPIMSSQEYKTIAAGKEVARKQVLKHKDKLHNETEIKNVNSEFDLIELQFTEGGKVQWGLSAQISAELNELEHSTARNEQQKNRLEILSNATYSVERLNEELQAEGSSLAKLNEKLAAAVAAIQKDPQVQTLWEKIIEAIKAIVQGISQTAQKTATNVAETAKKFANKVIAKRGESSLQER